MTKEALKDRIDTTPATVQARIWATRILEESISTRISVLSLAVKALCSNYDDSAAFEGELANLLAIEE